MAMFIGTASPLGATTAYASDVRMSGGSDRIVGTVYSDVAGSLFIEQGTPRADGTIDWDVSRTIAVTAATGAGFTEGIVAPKWRVRFTHAGAPGQTVFRLNARASAEGWQA